MILADTGPLVALFDPKDEAHARAVDILKKIREPLLATIPVLTEAFHLLSPGSQGSAALRTFLSRGGALVWFFSEPALTRALELMEKHADLPMDLADASLVVAAEVHRTGRVWTIDRRDFETYRYRVGKSHHRFVLIG